MGGSSKVLVDLTQHPFTSGTSGPGKVSVLGPMALHARLDVLRAILADGLVVTFHHEDAETSAGIARALIAGGVRALELLHRSDVALARFAELAALVRRDHPTALLGVGSIVDAPTAALYLAHGAEFVVGPNLDRRVARLCNRRKVAYLPGCGTVSEIAVADELGCEIVKLFPSSAMNGPEFVRSLHGPMPWSRVMPTGNGVAFSEASVREWFAAGACALGFGGALVDPQLVERRDFAGITKRAEQARAWIAASRAAAGERGR
jgi:2-dehydro-3-deoxyphosphogluconate aldolase/(4S)-4-hydroxy-2-oxoglutarate aldolase